MKWLFRPMLMTAFIFALTGCFAPIGNLGYDSDASGTPQQDVFWIVPKRTAYDINELFRRDSDLQAFINEGESVQSIPAEQLNIYIAEDPEQPAEATLVPRENDNPFKTKGRKLIVVEYAGSQDQYSVEVSDPYGVGGGGGNNNSGNGSGITVEWAKPE